MINRSYFSLYHTFLANPGYPPVGLSVPKVHLNHYNARYVTGKRHPLQKQLFRSRLGTKSIGHPLPLRRLPVRPFHNFRLLIWIGALTQPLYKHIIVESLKYCQKEKAQRLHGWIIMSKSCAFNCKCCTGYHPCRHHSGS